MSAPDVEIITYGGGDLLWQVFNAISMLFYGKNNSHFVQPLCVMSALIGGAWGISKCFFQSYIEGFINKYFLPVLILPTLFMLPQTSVHIIDKLSPQDRLNGKHFVVDHVPLLFAKIAGITSFWGYQMTQAIESVMHTPNDVQYCKTGMIFGSDAALDFSRLRLNNATMAQNLQQFTQQCIVYDIALGRYTLDEFRKSPNILGFLKKSTSQVRMIPYIDPQNKNREFLTCLESINKMAPLFDQEVKYYTTHEILKSIPLTYQTLQNFKNTSENKINEQIANVVNSPESICKDIVVANAFDSATARFAKERAIDNQRSIYQTAGSLAGYTLVRLRVVIEALIYACCVFILPLAMLPGGIKYIGNWIFLNIWIQLWPPLYAILNYISIVSVQKYAHSIKGDLSNGFSLFTSLGFQDMAYDVAALGGYLSLSVPLISFYLLQNLQSIAHLSGSLMSPAQTAANAASTELSTGNYSYANSSVGQISYDNQTSFQQNSAATLSSGFFTDNHGTHQIKYGNDHLTVSQDPSNLNTSISTAEAYSQQLHNAQQHAQTHLESVQNSYNENRGIAERSIADFVQHASNSEMYSDGYNVSEVQAVQESANWITNASESWGKQHGLSSRESLEYFASMGLGWPVLLEAKTGQSGNCSAISDEGRQEAQNIFDSQDYQKHYQNVLNSSHNESLSNTSDEGKRITENYTASMENLESSQFQLSSADSQLHQISENLSYIQSHTSAINSNLNTDFVNWLDERGDLGVLTNNKRSSEVNSLIHEFVSEKCEADIGNLQNYKDPSSFESSKNHNYEDNWGALKNNVYKKASESGVSFNGIQDHQQNIISQYQSGKSEITTTLSNQNNDLNNLQQGLKNDFSHENSKLNIERLNKRAFENIKSGFDKTSNIASSVSDYWFSSYAKPE